MAGSQDPYEAEEVLRILNTDDGIFQSVFVLLSGVQDVENLPIHYDIPFYFHFRVFVTANCVSFSVLAMNFWQYICMFRQKRSGIMENVCREYLYRSNRKCLQLCLIFLSFFVNQRSVPPKINYNNENIESKN